MIALILLIAIVAIVGIIMSHNRSFSEGNYYAFVGVIAVLTVLLVATGG